jgi:hypothetical protein
MTNHWLLRVGDGKHLFSSAQFGIWGINSKNSNAQGFIGFGRKGKNKKPSAKPGDIVWFIKGNSGGQAIACATFTEFVLREEGKTISNAELGWDTSLGGSSGFWDYEVRFANFTEIINKNILTEIKAACPIRIYNERCKADLPRIYDSLTV